jgi:hypothetical protein
MKDPGIISSGELKEKFVSHTALDAVSIFKRRHTPELKTRCRIKCGMTHNTRCHPE